LKHPIKVGDVFDVLPNSGMLKAKELKVVGIRKYKEFGKEVTEYQTKAPESKFTFPFSGQYLAMHTKRRRGIAVALIIFILAIIIGGFTMIVMNELFTGFQAYGQSAYPTGYYDLSMLTFFQMSWFWMPVIVIIVLSIWLYLRSQESGTEIAGG
jgi:hypothetical protein